MTNVRLENNAKIAVIGGGPAGTFFSIQLLKEAKRLNKRIDLAIIEKKKRLKPVAGQWQCNGCNLCAGTVSPRLIKALNENGFNLPDKIIQGEINNVWIQGIWKNFPIKVPEGMRMFSVFRGTLPPEMGEEGIGFDNFLLQQAVDEGARIFPGDALEIGYSATNYPELKIRKDTGEVITYSADFVAIATGVNIIRGRNYEESSFICSLQNIHSGFIPAKCRKSLIFELKIGKDTIDKYMKNEAYFIEYGSKDLPLEHIALLPKGNYLTVALIGKSIDNAVFPKDTKDVISKLLAIPHIKRIIPNLDTLIPSCICYPRMTVETAKKPFADRLAVIGDAAGSRLYKDGLYSSFITSTKLAETVANIGMDKASLSRGYGRVVQWLAADTRYGKLVFAIVRLTFTAPVLSRILYQAYATELKIKDASKRPLGTVLWKTASGTVDYKEILKQMFCFTVLKSAWNGFITTVINMLTECVFGIKWGNFGRYPTVVVKEFRRHIKKSIEDKLNIQLENNPEFERMYAIKIRSSASEIFNKIGNFGDAEHKFLKLRFFDINRISGLPNKLGSIIRYRFTPLKLSVELKLIRCIEDKALLYEASEKYASNGKLIFEIHPTLDGNYRFTIYTSFDFKRGKSIAMKIWWRIWKLIFPSYLHDVVWNHALCFIKNDIERTDF